jgi:hypothetical protein
MCISTLGLDQHPTQWELEAVPSPIMLPEREGNQFLFIIIINCLRKHYNQKIIPK